MKTTITDIKTHIARKLRLFGIDHDGATLYILLIQKGPQSALELAKATNIKRTQVYRTLEDLQGKQLVSADHLTYGTLYQAMPYEQLESTIIEKSAEVSNMRESLGSLKELFGELSGGTRNNAKVLHYSGVEGLKQVNWNLTKADGYFKVFEVAHLGQHFDAKFAKRCRERYIERGIKSYDLTNSKQVKSRDIEPYNPGMANYAYIDPNILVIQFEVYLYNDVVTLLDYDQDNVFCTEIYHPLFRKLTEQLFDLAWSQAIILQPL